VLDTNLLSPVKKQRRQKLLDAAQNQFVRHGFRATTMEGIADAAGISKVTVYSYFADKEEIFTAVGKRLGQRIRELVLHELAENGTAKSNIAKALVLKHQMVFETVRISPFAAELFQANANLIANFFDNVDAEIIERIAAIIVRGGLDENAARRKANLLFNAARGIAHAAGSPQDISDDITELVTRILD
jgi:AcrR family transcriptional regulator